MILVIDRKKGKISKTIEEDNFVFEEVLVNGEIMYKPIYIEPRYRNTHFNYVEFLGKAYLDEVTTDENEYIKRIYEFDTNQWTDPNNWILTKGNRLERVNFFNECFYYECKEEKKLSVYDPKTRTFLVKVYDHIEEANFNNEEYLDSIDSEGNTKEIYCLTTGRKVESENDFCLERTEFKGKTYIDQIYPDGFYGAYLIYYEYPKGKKSKIYDVTAEQMLYANHQANPICWNQYYLERKLVDGEVQIHQMYEREIKGIYTYNSRTNKWEFSKT